MMKRLLTAIALLAIPAVPALAQESNTTQCITDASGRETCVDTRLYIKGETPPPEPEPEPEKPPYAEAGAHLPLSYSLDDLTGTARFVATDGSGSECTEAKPCANVRDAYNRAVDGDPIIVRGGSYHNVGNTWSGSTWSSEVYMTKARMKLLPYPGETVTFDGSTNVIGKTWSTEGNLRWTAYTPRPCGNGFGVTFCTESGNDNVSGTDTTYPYNVGKWPDQVWVDGDKLQEVARKEDINDERFWVDRAQGRIYLSKARRDAATTEVAVCNLGDFLNVHGADVEFGGFTVQRYCAPFSRAAMVDVNAAADRLNVHDIVLKDTNIAFYLGGTTADALEDVRFTHVTVSGIGWMGINPMYTSRLVVDGINGSGLDPWNEFNSSPGSGIIKTSRTAHTVIKNSIFSNNAGNVLWFDESNFDTDVFNNLFEGTGIAGESSIVFYEISDTLDFYNNKVIAPISTGIKIAGSSNTRILNNEIVGGKDALGVYADGRSALNCATTGKLATTGAACQGYSSNRWAATWEPRPPALNWLTSMITVQGNILSYPKATGLCGSTTLVCIMRQNGADAQLKLDAIIPNGVKWDCNVYARESGDLVRASNPTSSAWMAYPTLPAWTSAMGQPAPYPAEPVDVHSLAGPEYVNPDGTPTEALNAMQSDCPFPSDAGMNAVIPAGELHYGTTYQ